MQAPVLAALVVMKGQAGIRSTPAWVTLHEKAIAAALVLPVPRCTSAVRAGIACGHGSLVPVVAAICPCVAGRNVCPVTAAHATAGGCHRSHDTRDACWQWRRPVARPGWPGGMANVRARRGNRCRKPADSGRARKAGDSAVALGSRRTSLGLAGEVRLRFF